MHDPARRAAEATARHGSVRRAWAPNRYPSATSTSGSSPSVAERRTLGALSHEDGFRFLVHTGVGLTTSGVATAGCAAPPSSCLRCLRDRCAGPATMTTTIATTHHSAPRSQA
jgi:hypothetical protein